MNPDIRKIVTFVFLVIFFFGCKKEETEVIYNINQYSEGIIGTWERIYKKYENTRNNYVLDSITGITSSQLVYQSDTTSYCPHPMNDDFFTPYLTFGYNNIVNERWLYTSGDSTFWTDGFDSPYTIQNDTLNKGFQSYQINKISESEMIIQIDFTDTYGTLTEYQIENEKQTFKYLRTED